MGGILKSIQSVLVALIILALIGTGLIIWYNAKASRDAAAVEETAAETAPETQEDVSLPPGSAETETVVSSPNKQHEHIYTSSVAEKPSCTRAGLMRYTCSCGDFYTEAIAPLEHKEGDWIIVREPTKTRDGLRQKRCTRCNEIVREEVISKSTVSGNSVSDDDKDSHVHYYQSKITTEASCTENGERTFTCEECGSSYKSSIPALNHPSRQTLVTEASCNKPGSVETSCALCGAVLSHDSIPALEHNRGAWTVTKNATADAEGTEERTCSLCGEKETRSIPKVIEGVNHTHSYDTQITRAASCTETGSATHTCTCGDTYTETLAALGHLPGNWVTVTEPSAAADGLREKYCRRCGELVQSEIIPYEEPCSHNYESKITREPTCTRSGTRTYTCSKCGDTYTANIDPIPHKYVVVKDDGGNVIDRQCNMCGESDPDFVKSKP